MMERRLEGIESKGDRNELSPVLMRKFFEEPKPAARLGQDATVFSRRRR